jgi:hypothetical protein
MTYLKLIWFEGDLRFLTRNTIIDVLIRKHDRSEEFWAWVDRALSFRRKTA